MANGKKHQRKGWVLVIALCAALISGNSATAKNIFDWRFVLYPSLPIGGDAGMEKMNTLMDEMRDLGYNCMLIDGPWMRKLHKPTVMGYRKRVGPFLAEAKKRGIEIIPMSQGQHGTTYQDQNLREALPTKGTPFIVAAGEAKAKGDPAVVLRNADFENPLGAGNWVGGGKHFRIASETRPGSSGKSCLRCDSPDGNSRLVKQIVKVKPYRTYELSVWAKAKVVKPLKGSDPTGGTFFTVMSAKQPWLLKDRDWRGISRNGQWKEIKQKFNSLANTEVTIRLNATDYAYFEGTVWFDDAKIREVGLYETSPHPSMPVVVKTKTGTILKPGADYVVHEERLTIPAGSAAKDGEELIVDWATTATVMHTVAEATLCYDNVWDGMRQQIRLQDEWFDNPRARLMKYSEWRLGGWDPTCIEQYDISRKGSGPYWAGTANKTAQLYREANSNRVSLIFSDNFNPYHSSSPKGYVINGGNLGSGHLLDPNIIVCNWWAGGNAVGTLKYFAGIDPKEHGIWGKKTTVHRQILSCNGGAWVPRLRDLAIAEKEGLKDGTVIGIGYQTYTVNIDLFFKNIGPLAAAAKAAGRWGTGPLNLPAASTNPVNNPARYKGTSLTKAIDVSRAVRRFEFTVPKNENVELAVFDLQGKRVVAILDEHMAANTYERHLDVSKLAPGMYFVTLAVSAANGPRRITQKMLLF